MPVFSGGDKIARKPAIAGELTGLNDLGYKDIVSILFVGSSTNLYTLQQTHPSCD